MTKNLPTRPVKRLERISSPKYDPYEAQQRAYDDYARYLNAYKPDVYDLTPDQMILPDEDRKTIYRWWLALAILILLGALMAWTLH